MADPPLDSPPSTPEALADLLTLTSLPTAAGREGRVIAFLESWVAARPGLRLDRDRFGNLTIRRAAGAPAARPIYFTAHLDHPSFVVLESRGPREAMAEFRGGVKPTFFAGARVRWTPNAAEAEADGWGPVIGEVEPIDEQPASPPGSQRPAHPRAIIRWEADAEAQPGDPAPWAIEPAHVDDAGLLHAPACDDLAGVAAALAAFERVALGENPPATEVRLLLTRAEEVGFIGAIAAARSRRIPPDARLICLENSRSYAESPIGGGPIVRVGDRTSTFDPGLTYAVGRIAQTIEAQDADFRWQRRLMPGGTCEASAFQSYGYAATCLCLALGNYHNMDEEAGVIAAERISVADYLGLVRLLEAIAHRIDDPIASPGLRDRLESLFAEGQGVL